MEIKQVSLKDYSSMRVGGMGNLVVVKNEDELAAAVEHTKSAGLVAHIIGGGTNSYFAENVAGYLFIKLELKGVQLLEDGTLTAYASENWDDVVRGVVEQGYWGIENLSHIPGDVGAAPMQNIGAYGVELKDTLVSVRVLDTIDMTFKELNNEDCAFGYRDSIFKKNRGRYIIVSITLKLSKEKKPVLTYKPLDMFLGKNDVTLAEIRALVIQTRDLKLPDWHEYPNTGSFFKNPIVDKAKVEELKSRFPEMVTFDTEEGVKVSAAWLIEHVAEMKGVQKGNVGTWPKQPLVIVNYGEASADEINIFAHEITEKIKEKTGIVLDREVNYIGPISN